MRDDVVPGVKVLLEIPKIKNGKIEGGKRGASPVFLSRDLEKKG